MNKITVGSLFSGIGGLEYGLERTNGFETKWQCEVDDYATKVLEKHWPDVTRFRDVRTVGKHNLASVDLICGGFPCQPHSLAGKRKASGDERDLWGEFYRVICEIKSDWVVAENVPGLLSSENGRFFGRILRDLAEAGYDASWQCLRASDFGAPHQRERIFIVAHAVSSRRTNTRYINAGPLSIGQEPGWQQDTNHAGRSSASNVAHATSQQGRWLQQRGVPSNIGYGSESMAHASEQGLPLRGYAGLTTSDTQTARGMDAQLERRGELGNCGQAQSGMGRDIARLSDRLDGDRWPSRPGEQQHEWEPPRVVTEKVANRAQRLKVLGNAVVPQVAEYIGRCILAIVESEVAA